LLDVTISAWFHAHTHPVLTQVMLVITHVHSTMGICLLAACIALWLLRSRRFWWLLALGLSVPGGLILNAAVKQLFQRARPQFDDPLLSLTTYSFPSGHTAGATVFYGFLTVLLLAHVRERRWRVSIFAGASCMVILVALSRIYLGVHYLSDVIGAIVEGVIWLALCLTGVRALWRRSTMGST
jgi:membrane-associated phospholipid phosphatase